MWRIRRLLRYVRWLFTGRRMISYPGFMCSCCGKWVGGPFSIPEYESCGEWGDTIGLCEEER